MESLNEIEQLEFRRKELGYGEDLAYKLFNGKYSYVTIRTIKSNNLFKGDMANEHTFNIRNIDLVKECDTFIDFSLLTKTSIDKANKHKRTYKKILLAIAYNKPLNRVVFKFYNGKTQENKSIIRDLLIKCIQQYGNNLKIIRADRLFNEWLQLEQEFNIRVCVVKKSKDYPYNSNAERQIGLFKSQFYNIVERLPNNANLDKLISFLNVYIDEVLNHNYHIELIKLYRDLLKTEIILCKTIIKLKH